MCKREGRGISIHAPRTGSDRRFQRRNLPNLLKFQSTLPARGATATVSSTRPIALYFNPRSPHGERHRQLKTIYQQRNFNPRSPHGERRASTSRICGILAYFNPRSPHGERRGDAGRKSRHEKFQSTLPARGATLLFRALRRAHIVDFNPRSPHGERPSDGRNPAFAAAFQSTLPARGATEALNAYGITETFQSTLPARGATGAAGCESRRRKNFNPRSPHGERPSKSTKK